MQRNAIRIISAIALVALLVISIFWLVNRQMVQRAQTLATPNYLPLIQGGTGTPKATTTGQAETPTPTLTTTPTTTPTPLATSTAYPTVDLEEEPEREGQRPDERPVLTLKSIKLSPAYPLKGEQVDVTVEIANAALANVPDTMFRLYAGDDQLVAKRIDLLANYTTTLHFSWSPAAAGEVTIVGAVDPEHELVEDNEQDNSLALDVAVGDAKSQADLAVNDVKIETTAGQTTMLHAQVTNLSGAAGPVPLILRANGVIVATSLLPALAQGAKSEVEIPLAVGPLLGQVSVEVNPRFKMDEKNANNNMATLDLRPKIDLLVDELSVSAPLYQVEQPRKLTVSFRIVNAGSQSITQTFTTHIFPGDQDPAPGVKAASQGFDLVTNGLAAGSVLYGSRTVYLGSSEDDFDVVVNVDSTSAVAEENESNNTATSHYNNPVPDVNRWISIGPTLIADAKHLGYGWDNSSGRLSSIAIDPGAPDTLYVGGNSSGIWKTVDGGANWQSLTDSLPTANVAALALDPTNAARLFWVTNNSGFYRSDNSGTSWNQISTANLDAIVHGGILLIDPSNISRMFVASNSGVYRSIDGGVTWQLALNGGAATGLIQDPTNASRFYAAIYHDTDDTIAGIYMSANSGANWQKLTGCPGGSLPATNAKTKITLAASGSKLFAGFRGPSSFKLLRTTTTGCSIGGRLESAWETGWTTTDQNQYSTLWSGMWADPTDPNYLYLGGTNVWRSTNSGSSFDLVASLGGPPDGAHSDNHGFGIDPTNSARIYMLNDGGIYRSDDHGKAGSYTFIGNGLANGEIYDIADAQTDPNLVIGGTQDNGTLKYDSSSTVWKMFSGGDGASVDIDPTNAQILYFMSQYVSSLGRSTNGGANGSNIAGGLPTGATCFNVPFQVHPGIPTTLLASCSFDCGPNGCEGGLWRTTNPGDPWAVIFAPTSGMIIRSAVDAKVDLYYAGSSDGRLFGGPSGGNWQQLFTNPSGASAVSDIEVDLDTPTIVYLSFNRTGSGRIFRLQRTSAQPTSMTGPDITADLPTNLRVAALAVDRMNPLTIYAGTQMGVYQGRSFDNGATWHWAAYMNGMPTAVNITDLEVHPTTGALRASTFGRSVYEVNTNYPVGSVLAAQGKITFLRVNDVGGGYGPPTDFIDGEVIIQLDSTGKNGYGFQLRTDGEQAARTGMLDELRDAFNNNATVRVDYVRTGLHNGTIIRILELP